MEEYTFSVEAMIRGHHVYKEIWIPVEGEILSCMREVGNSRDPMAVAVKKGSDVVGHVPRKISAVCSIFLRRGGTINCRVAGHRRYSSDLEQGGLEVPCVLTFSVSSPHNQVVSVEKTEKLVKSALAVKSTSESQQPSVAKPCDEPSFIDTSKDTCSDSNTVSSYSKKTESDIISISDDELAVSKENLTDQPHAKKPRSADVDIEKIIMGARLSDIHINIAQKLLKDQFCSLNGLESTLLQTKEVSRTEEMVKNKLQIIYCCEREHWIVATTIKSSKGEILVADSIFKSLDIETRRTINMLFKPTGTTKMVDIKLLNSQKQKGSNDCGLFAIAFATAFANGMSIEKIRFHQESMRAHLVRCFYTNKLTMFPIKDQ